MLGAMSGIIAIVGRPNVGKSALFNRIIGRRLAIVHDQPGVTRDRVTAEAEWRGRPYTLIDTGGIGLLRGEKSQDVIVKAAVEQVDMAIESASVIILVVNVQEGVVPLDHEVAKRLRSCGKPVLLAVNKVDNYATEAQADEFTRLGFAKVFPVTAIHGVGIDALVDAAGALLPPFVPTEKTYNADGEESHENVLKLAIVGRPNVGKSSIINSITQSERVIVSEIPGTTRDAVDVPFEVETDGIRQQYLLIDTAGLRKARRVDDSIEFFSVKRTEEAIERSDIVVLVVDAEVSITEQDKKIADKIIQARKACIVVINKWDLVSEEVAKAREAQAKKRNEKENYDRGGRLMTTFGEFSEWVQSQLFFLDYAPVIFTSAKSGFHLDRLLEAVRYVAAQLKQKVPTAILNRTLQDAIERKQPVSAKGTRLSFYYATQVRQSPPTFLLFVNRDELFSDQYYKYLSGELRRAFGFEGCPLILVPKARPKTIDPVRKYNKPKSQAERIEARKRPSERAKDKDGKPKSVYAPPKRAARKGRPARIKQRTRRH
ncbi:MAG: ribosome biogenesis GTPase Der [Verrucomicrobiota bacterium]